MTEDLAIDSNVKQTVILEPAYEPIVVGIGRESPPFKTQVLDSTIPQTEETVETEENNIETEDDEQPIEKNYEKCIKQINEIDKSAHKIVCQMHEVAQEIHRRSIQNNSVKIWDSFKQIKKEDYILITTCITSLMVIGQFVNYLFF